jgi:multiple antibiotic resistance protein
MTAFDQALSAFVTLFVTIDPPGLAPLFLALTAGMSRGERRQIALRAILTAFGILLLFAVAGLGILSVFGITIHAFRIAGGLLLFRIAFDMIFEKRQERHERSAERAVTADQIRNIAIFPLAIPLIAGPGAISATILLSGTFATPLGRLALILIIAVNLAVAWLVFVVAERLGHLLGATGRTVLTRLLGLILAALSVQFVADGIAALIRAGA